MEASQNTSSTARRHEFQQIAAMTLDAALSERETQVFMRSLKHLIRARGVAATARKAGLNRTALYKVVSSSGNPRLVTLIALLSAVGLRVAVEPLGESNPPPASP